jgi:hypothetical protein
MGVSIGRERRSRRGEGLGEEERSRSNSSLLGDPACLRGLEESSGGSLDLGIYPLPFPPSLVLSPEPGADPHPSSLPRFFPSYPLNDLSSHNKLHPARLHPPPPHPQRPRLRYAQHLPTPNSFRFRSQPSVLPPVFSVQPSTEQIPPRPLRQYDVRCRSGGGYCCWWNEGAGRGTVAKDAVVGLILAKEGERACTVLFCQLAGYGLYMIVMTL